MTYPEFKYTLQNGGLEAIQDIVVVNYNLYPDSNYRVDAIAILIDGNLTQLQQATAITTVIPETGQSITINVETSLTPFREVERSRVGDFYVYNIITENQRPIISGVPTNGEQYDMAVSIEPVVAVGSYNYNTYNPLIGNTITDRESSYIVHSDRGTTTLETKTNPVNIQSILSDRAIHASVQDSVYSDTGWINGRYEGTKTNAEKYGGIDPTITGISFTGAYYPINIADATISAATTDTRTIKEYFYIPGKGITTAIPVVTVPSDPSAPAAVYEASGPTSPTRTSFDFEVTSGATEVTPIQVGDYMYLYNVDEIVKVEQVERVGGTTNTTVKRYMFGTNPNPTTSVVTTTARVMKDISRIYQVENNRIEFVSEGKVWIQASGDILRMDELGYSATGSVAL
jgi:hypothetical protein